VWILPASYAPVRELLAVCVLPSLLYAVSEVTGVGAMIARRSSLVMAAATATAAANVGLNFWMIPQWGARGAATATMLSFFLMLVLRTETAGLSWQRLPRSGVCLPTGLACAAALSHAYFGAAHPVETHALWFLMLVASAWHYREALNDAFRQLLRSSTPAA
jgi:O-antigen/teichoic acid export membrane protein